MVRNSSRPCHAAAIALSRSEEHTSELQSQSNIVCRLLLEKKKKNYVSPFWVHRFVDTLTWNPNQETSAAGCCLTPSERAFHRATQDSSAPHLAVASL